MNSILVLSLALRLSVVVLTVQWNWKARSGVTLIKADVQLLFWLTWVILFFIMISILTISYVCKAKGSEVFSQNCFFFFLSFYNFFNTKRISTSFKYTISSNSWLYHIFNLTKHISQTYIRKKANCNLCGQMYTVYSITHESRKLFLIWWLH